MKSCLTRIGKILCIALLSSCSMQNYCEKHFKPQSNDSLTTEITHVPDTVTIYVPYQDISFDTSNVLPPELTFHKEIKKDGLSAVIDAKDGKLSLNVSKDSAKIKSPFLRKETKITDKRQVVIHDTAYLEHWYTEPLIWWFILSLIFIIIFIAIKYLKK